MATKVLFDKIWNNYSLVLGIQKLQNKSLGLLSLYTKRIQVIIQTQISLVQIQKQNKAWSNSLQKPK